MPAITQHLLIGTRHAYHSRAARELTSGKAGGGQRQRRDPGEWRARARRARWPCRALAAAT